MNVTARNSEVLHRYLSDMRTLEIYMIEAFQVHEREKDLQANENASALISRALCILGQHIDRMDRRLGELEEQAEDNQAASPSTMGLFVNFMTRLHSEEVSEILRDGYTMINLAAIGYTMLHTAALAMDDVVTAELSLGHLCEFTPLVREVNQIMPSALIDELGREFPLPNPNAAEAARHNTEQAWHLSA
ncbi:MAG: hypothetical protein JF599_00960 [Verrucomicrobia bacterium]|nr:hypothetical protein [Verrucomicrobiota bacterium]